MIIKAKVVWEVNVTIDVNEKTPTFYAKAAVLNNACDLAIAKPKITHCIERPDIVDKEESK